ncbi:hypothetical protein ACRAWG_38065 [Methylobacterium sp. P31]
MRRPDQPALTDAGTGRVSMPFLPTLAVVALLGVASVYCPSSKSAGPALRADLIETPAPSPTDFARTATAPAPPRLPASLAFAEAYPLDASAPKAGATLVRPMVAARPAPHVASAVRRACPGRRCPELPQRGTDPLAATHAEAAEPAEDDLLPRKSLPFTASVAETLAPAARVVDEAADLVRGGAAAVQGSVAMAVADCLR